MWVPIFGSSQLLLTTLDLWGGGGSAQKGNFFRFRVYVRYMYVKAQKGKQMQLMPVKKSSKMFLFFVKRAYITYTAEGCKVLNYNLWPVTLELGSIEGISLTCCAQPPFPCPFQCWPRTWIIPLKNHYKTALEERKTGIRAVWPKLSVLDCRYVNGVPFCQ